MRLLWVLLGAALMLPGAVLEALFIAGRLATGVGLLERFKESPWLLAGPLLFFVGLALMLFGIFGKGWLNWLLMAVSVGFGLAWTVFNFTFDK